MKLKSFGESFRNFRKTMKGLTFEERIDHIWAYYKWELLGIVLISIAIYGLITWLCSTPIETVFSGNLTNCSITEEGYRYLTDDYLQMLGVNSEENNVTLSLTTTAGTMAATTNVSGVDQGVRVAAMVAAGSLDFIITDSVGLEFYAIQGAFETVNDVLTQEQLALFADKVYYHTDTENGETYPIAIEISDLPFVEDCMEDGKKLYLGFPIHAPHAERLTEFFDYLLTWKK